MSELQLKFYSALWENNSAFKSVWYGEKDKPPALCKWFQSTAEALKFIDSLDKNHYNIYHACSLFRARNRLQTKVVGVKALWVDIDLKDTKCNNVYELYTKCNDYYKDYEFGIDFWVIDTGHGLHLYWIFENALSLAHWQLLANRLHNFNKQNKIPIDPARTRDSASMLRCPGTYNLKTQPIEVKILKEGRLLKTPEFKEPVLKKKPNYNNADFKLNNAVAEMPTFECDAEKIAAKCQIIGEFKKSALEGNEPVRYKAISVVRLCTGGHDAVHTYFSSHSRYTKEWANKQMHNLETKQIGAALCKSFDDLGMCTGCPHKGKIKTPMQLGIIAQTFDKKINEIQSDKAKERAELFISLAPQQGWNIGKNGIYKIVEEIPVLVTQTPFFIIDKFSENAKDQTVITILVRAFLPTGVADFRIPLKYMAEDRSLMGEFNGRGMFPINKKLFKDYIINYCNNLAHIPPHQAASALGWQPNGSFLYNQQGDGFSKAGEPITSIVDPRATSYASGFESKGTLKTWQEVITLYKESPTFKPHLFSLMCSLGAPLLSFTSAKGFVLSLQGISGCGKTLSHMFASSAWGCPQTAGSIGTKDTNTSMLGRLGSIKNMPLRLDEATTLSTSMLSGLIYELVNGRGRARATIDGSLSGNSTEWETITLITTNSPLLEHKIADISEAARYRILELEVKMPENMMHVGRRIGEIMDKNYGLCGKPFIEWVVKNKETTIKYTDYYFKKFQSHVSSDKRFWVSCGAVAFAAATIAQKIGLFDVDIRDMLAWFLDVLDNQTSLNNNFIVETRGFETKDEFMYALRDALYGYTLRINQDGTEIASPPREVKATLKHTDNDGAYFYVRAPILTEFIKQHYTESIKTVRERLQIDKSKSIRCGSLVGRFYEFKL